MGGIYGVTAKGVTAVTCAVDSKRVSRVQNPTDGHLVKLSVWMDGNGAGLQDQHHRAVVYSTGGTLLAQGTDVVVLKGAAPAWVDFPFVAPVFLDGAADYDYGIHSGGTEASSRVFAVDPDGAGGKDNTDTYSDGPAAAFGAATARTYRMSLFASWVNEWSPPVGVDDFYIGRLPWWESQRVFGAGNAASAPILQADVGWHGDALDEETGAFCLVQEGSEWEQLIGERIRLTRVDGGESVFVYVHNRWAIEDNLSVSRRAFIALGFPAADNFRCKVEVME